MPSSSRPQPDREPQISAEPRPPYPIQRLAKPGIEAEMELQPRWQAARYMAAGKLEGRVALITGGDSGIGRAVAYLYALEGADVAITSLPTEQEDARITCEAVLHAGCRAVNIEGDLTEPAFCREAVERTVRELGRLDILVSNAAWQNRKESIDDITPEEWQRTFRTNVDACFYLCQAAIPHLRPGSAIITTTSQVGLLGSKNLLDYAASKGAIIAFTKSLAQALVEQGIRVNAVAPGPVWTPLNPADTGASQKKIEQFGAQTPMGRAAQPEEIAPAYVFLASDADSSYVTGIVLEEMGGTPTSG
jgi:NAD(P)-dependent dehydrogenase (short-subunit alcohol dehydrogenase family)